MYRRLLVVAQLGLVFAAIAHGEALIVNGGFENGQAGWTFTDPDHNGSIGEYAGSLNGVTAHTGTSFVWSTEDSTANPTILQQTGIRLTEGQRYTLTFYVMNFQENTSATPNNALDVYWNGEAIAENTNIAATNSYSALNYTIYGADDPGTLTFTLSNSVGGLALDDVSLQPAGSSDSGSSSDTPEPGTLYSGLGALLLMLGMGLKRVHKSA